MSSVSRMSSARSVQGGIGRRPGLACGHGLAGSEADGNEDDDACEQGYDGDIQRPASIPREKNGAPLGSYIGHYHFPCLRYIQSLLTERCKSVERSCTPRGRSTQGAARRAVVAKKRPAECPDGPAQCPEQA